MEELGRTRKEGVDRLSTSVADGIGKGFANRRQTQITPPPSTKRCQSGSPYLTFKMDDDEMIVVDDFETESIAGPSMGGMSMDYNSPPPRSTPELGRQSSRLRHSTIPYGVSADSTERTTRSSALKSRPPPKLKFKLSEKAAAQAPGMSFLGQYDRELDSDDEELAFEEQFILRMPPGEDCERLRKMVATREISNDVWFKFKGMRVYYILHNVSPTSLLADSRRAVFHIGNSTYNSKLVDLPCVIESQKTLDNKQMFKVADICQVEISVSLYMFHVLMVRRFIDACC